MSETPFAKWSSVWAWFVRIDIKAFRSKHIGIACDLDSYIKPLMLARYFRNIKPTMYRDVPFELVHHNFIVIMIDRTNSCQGLNDFYTRNMVIFVMYNAFKKDVQCVRGCNTLPGAKISVQFSTSRLKLSQWYKITLTDNGKKPKKSWTQRWTDGGMD